MGHQNLKKISRIHIDHKKNKICQNEGFLKKSLFHTAWFLQKMALKQKQNYKHLVNLQQTDFCMIQVSIERNMNKITHY